MHAGSKKKGKKKEVASNMPSNSCVQGFFYFFVASKEKILTSKDFALDIRKILPSKEKSLEIALTVLNVK